MPNQQSFHTDVLRHLSDSLPKIATVWQRQHSNQPEFADALIISVSDGQKRARTRTLHVEPTALQSSDWADVFPRLEPFIQQLASKFNRPIIWCRIEWVYQCTQKTWQAFQEELTHYKRNYFRSGLAVPGKREPWLLMTEAELNAYACLYPGSSIAHAMLNKHNFQAYFKARHGSGQWSEFSEDTQVWTFNTAGIFIDTEEMPSVCHTLATGARQWGRRALPALTPETTGMLITESTDFLARQVQNDGQYIYGYFPCFNRQINTYNSLRHASSTYALLEGYETCLEQRLLSPTKLQYIREQIQLALDFLCRHCIKEHQNAAYLVDTGEIIKLGANAVTILALSKYTQVMQDTRYLPLMRRLAQGIVNMQQENGSFVHVLDANTFKVKEKFRIIYYDGEAAFALMRLYGLTKEQPWLDCVERAFDYFIRARHDKAHDHWLSYCSNELISYKPERKYFEFAVNNIKGYLDFIQNRLTTFPTLLELCMAFHKVLQKLTDCPQYYDVLQGFDINEFYQALHTRANYLVNGFFFPEVAMFFKSPITVLHGFFIRHHGFRVRIDDVEHYLSGFVAYRKLLCNPQEALAFADREIPAAKTITPLIVKELPLQSENTSTVAWGGDVNLGRRLHYLSTQHGINQVLNIPVLKEADFTIVNLECVISVSGEQGRAKGEGGPFYYRARPEMTAVLQAAGVDAVTCANNHSGDYGTAALTEQAAILDAAGIAHVGTGKTPGEAFAPIFHTLPNGVRVALFCADATIRHYAVSAQRPGAAYLDPKMHQLWYDTFQPLFRKARQEADIVLIAVHWGANERNLPDNDEIAIGHHLIDAGADAVLGASAHRLQGVEIYQGKAIIHDAGDLLFDVVNSHKSGGIFRLNISPRGIESLRMYPVWVQSGKTVAMPPEDALKAGADFAGLCRQMNTPVDLLQDGSINITLTPKLTEPLKNKTISAENPVRKVQPDERIFTRWSAETRQDLVLENIPDDALLQEPVSFGAMTLVGIRTRPHFFNRRRMLWVESFWRAQTPIEEDFRIHFQAKPIFPTTKMRSWGVGSDHDPCDWLIPTSRWQPGKIYRDFYGLRPPYLNAWEDGPLQLQVRVLSNYSAYPFVMLPFTYHLHNSNVQYDEQLPRHLCYRQKFTDNVYEHHTKGTWNAEQLASVTQGKWLTEPPPGWFTDSVVAGKKHIAMANGRVMFLANSNNNRAAHENNTKPPVPFDRHNQLAELQNQLAGAIVERPVAGLKPDFPVLQVSDPIKAWIELGIAARSRFTNPIIAVTGSVGKSSTCQMIKTMLGDKRVFSSLDNYNSRVGVPGNLASLAPDYDAAVIEVAQSALWMRRGPITRFLRPDVAVITEIGLTQTHFVKSLEQAIRIKCKIFDGLSRRAIAVVGAHLPHFDRVLQYAREHAKKVIIYGEHPESVIRIKSIQGDYRSSTVILDTERGQYTFTLPMPTKGMAKSAVAAFSAVYALNGDLNKAVEYIENYHGIDGRLQVYELPVADGHLTLVDDNYNAAFDSMINAFTLFGMQEKAPDSRRIYVLGRLVDMGDKAREIHQALAQPLLASQPDLIITHGDEMQYLREVLPPQLLGEHFSDVYSLARYIRGLWQKNDVILIKGSSSHSDFPLLAGLLRA